MKFLASLLLLAPALAFPTPDEMKRAEQECSAKSADFTGWDVKDLQLKSTMSKSMPLFSLGKQAAELTFTVENEIIGHSVDCKATAVADLSAKQTADKLNDSGDNVGEFDGQYEYTCESDEEQGGEVTFSFDEASGDLKIKQKWECNDDPDFPMYYTGSGSGTADLDCETSEPKFNDLWKMGSKEDFSSAKKDCKKTDVHVELTSMDASG